MKDTHTLGFNLADGTPVYIESADPAGLQRIGRGDEPLQADIDFEHAIARIRPAAQALLDSLKELNTPDEIQLEFGIKFSAKAGAIIASANSEAAFKVSLSWKNGD